MVEVGDFAVEYAKSGRSNCKKCRSQISAGSVRIAIYRSSRFHDGLDPHWHHKACIIGKNQSLRSINQLQGLSKLKWVDQENLRNLLGGKSDDAPSNKRKDPEADEAPDGTEERPAKKAKGNKSDADPPAKTNDVQDKLRKQAEWFWKIKNELHKNVPSSRSRKETFNSVLAHNGVSVRGTRFTDSEFLDILADCMAFGVAQLCPDCGNSRLIAGENQYFCPFESDWSTCTYQTTSPIFSAFTSPDDIDEEYFINFKFKPVERVLQASSQQKSASANNTTAPAKPSTLERFPEAASEHPFEGMTIAFVGRGKSLTQAKNDVQNAKGVVSAKVDDKVTLLVTSEGETPNTLSTKRKDARKFEVDVVNEKYIQDCIEQKMRFRWKKPEYIVEDNSTKVEGTISGSQTSTSGTNTKLILKNGAAVFEESGLVQTHHVYRPPGGTSYTAVLVMSDAASGKNSYYKLQILAHDKISSYCLFRIWGRVGNHALDSLKDIYENPSDAIHEFCRLFRDKTGHEFVGNGEYGKKPGKWFPLQLDMSEPDGPDESHKDVVMWGSKTKLEKRVQDLLAMILDMDAVRRVMLEFEVNLEAMPLGKIKRSQVQSAYQVLKEAIDSLNRLKMGEHVPESKWIEYTNRFFSLIPTVLPAGSRSAPLLKSWPLIQQRVELCDALMDVEAITTLMSNNVDTGEEDPADAKYKQLDIDLVPLDKDSAEYKMVEECARTTHAPTHSYYTLEILDVFKVRKEMEVGRFEAYTGIPQSANGDDSGEAKETKEKATKGKGKKRGRGGKTKAGEPDVDEEPSDGKIRHNRRLLWHGSRTTNFAGILTQSLRIAPPEAPVSGYMFGKGVYFADMISKSANYCMVGRNNPEGLLLLCEVALGDMYERTHAEYVEKLPSGMSSTKGLGSTVPTKFVPHPEDPELMVPMGPPVSSKEKNSKNLSLLYNEYIVYDTAQIKMRYLIKTRFHFT